MMVGACLGPVAQPLDGGGAGGGGGESATTGGGGGASCGAGGGSVDCWDACHGGFTSPVCVAGGWVCPSTSCGGDAGVDAGPGSDDADDAGELLCYLNQGLGGNCGWFFPDGGPAPAGHCGGELMSPTCLCTRDDAGAYHVLCTGACVPTADGGVERTCGPGPGCGTVACGSGTSCVGPSVCQ